MLQIQFHDVKGSDLDQWKTDAKQTILWPDKYATGKINYPYTEAKKDGARRRKRTAARNKRRGLITAGLFRRTRHAVMRLVTASAAKQFSRRPRE